ncbi:HD domain-containing protein [Clostridium botulinum]|uniref:Metal dependent phosphohydrolase n=1 Tax=Clostridium botulinum (strain Hall / ATCC 3502 / NCTC 13319 / Type A) TaxID=441771 RepID=A5I0U0_CLOBH|nr:HD domain-containing protein [Clostridium botulinum]ABS34840.1 HD domain protein [Clostridium botulinum A str. ATCC 19397]ABS38030.1 HD domain protein [Clostridium botulinum A str. Hall]AWB17019.1 phosphohydrolase [Clostridium botulinum]EGT5614892.1 HD domain-containing protein [Clostridium botulinum]EGT5622045.1 HD domain-containing protein [Clostridium botulinum]
MNTRDEINKDIQKVFKDIDEHILKDEKPSNYINKLYEEGKLEEYPFDMLTILRRIDQSPKYHPEGSVWNHIMMVLDNGAKERDKSENERIFMWACLLHDIGKGTTTKIRKGRITSYNHDKEGERLSIKFLKCFTEDEEFIKEVSKLVRWHMQPLFVNKNLPFKDIESMVKEVSIKEIALISLCDRLGRGGMSEGKKEEEIKAIDLFIEKCSNYM